MLARFFLTFFSASFAPSNPSVHDSNKLTATERRNGDKTSTSPFRSHSKT